MAEMSTQDPTPVYADDQMRDRAREFVEFLSDDVSATLCLMQRLFGGVWF